LILVDQSGTKDGLLISREQLDASDKLFNIVNAQQEQEKANIEEAL
jgi:hypothetical protein